MASSKKEKHYPNTRARRHSSDTSSKKSKREKDTTDTESVISSSTSSADTAVEPKKCPLRFMLAGMIDTPAGEVATAGCPLRRVQLWHTIPLCLLAIINLLLVIIALLGLAGYRIAIGVQTFAISIAKSEGSIFARVENHSAIGGSEKP